MVFTPVDILNFLINFLSFGVAITTVYALITEAKHWSGNLRHSLLLFSYAAMSYLVMGITLNIFQELFGRTDFLTLLTSVFYFVGLVFAFFGVMQLRKFSEFFVGRKR